MFTSNLDRPRISYCVKKVLAAESSLHITSDEVADDEPLNGDLLTLNSFALVGMLVRLEEELGITLADDLFVGRSFTTVRDVVDVLDSSLRAQS
ncbi:acyl carrier protein [Salinispora arenicola]|uniref:Carrier domain-containing protein n=1 Tax=Salinispora arenicola (strain CNS-205) TaxID=391037 RepID=A8M858_SALAI|nr:acyl carrier protein [Salinispora arenicola]NIL58645.1 acyl carrier protein [Salinispora arenicola]NIL63824.1 acyl carrier protein [Salinispora arenicola]